MRGETAARPGKRPLRALSAAEKMDAIQRVHEGESKASVARDIGVPESTLRGWCKSEHKIRGMARNSCTPDSEAHSPASVSTNANNSSSIAGVGVGSGNSEDESCTLNNIKRQKIAGSDNNNHHHNVGVDAQQHTDIERIAKKIDGQTKIDYAALMASVAAIRPENGGSLLLQQLGLLSTATSSIGKSLLQVPSAGGGGGCGTTHNNTVVGLVENGLQYTRSTTAAAAGVKRQQSTSAVAPTQVDTEKSGSRNNILPPAAEAPFAPAPASPRKTNENHHHHHHNHNNQHSVGGVKTKKQENENNEQLQQGNTSTGNNKVDEALWLWLTQQQQLLGQQSAIFNPGAANQDLGGSWFWKWYKQYGFAPAAPTPAANNNTVVKKSPTKARAMLDNVLGSNNNNSHNHNNNENVIKRNSNVIVDEGGDNIQNDVDNQDQVQISTEEAVAHGETFLKWLEKCSEPSVSRMQIMQFRYLLDNLKNCRKPISSLKRSRK